MIQIKYFNDLDYVFCIYEKFLAMMKNFDMWYIAFPLLYNVYNSIKFTNFYSSNYYDGYNYFNDNNDYLVIVIHYNFTNISL